MKMTNQQVRDEIKRLVAQNDGITSKAMQGILGVAISTVHRVARDLTIECEIFRSGSISEYYYHATGVYEPVRKFPRPDIVAEYRANSPVYRFDKLQAAARAAL